MTKKEVKDWKNNISEMLSRTEGLFLVDASPSNSCNSSVSEDPSVAAGACGAGESPRPGRAIWQVPTYI